MWGQDLPACCHQAREGRKGMEQQQGIDNVGVCEDAVGSHEEGRGVNSSGEISWQCSETACSPGTLPCGFAR